MNLVLAINADSETIKNDMSLGNIIYSANNYFNSFFSSAFETGTKTYLGTSQNNEVEIKIGNERITIGVRNKVSGKMERQEFLFLCITKINCSVNWRRILLLILIHCYIGIPLVVRLRMRSLKKYTIELYLIRNNI